MKRLDSPACVVGHPVKARPRRWVNFLKDLDSPLEFPSTLVSSPVATNTMTFQRWTELPLLMRRAIQFIFAIRSTPVKRPYRWAE